MSMKFMQQIQEDHTDLQELKNKKEKNYDKRLTQLNNDIKDLRGDVTEKLDIIIKLLNEMSTETYIEREDKPKIDKKIEEDIKTFIPDIDTSDMSINSKEDEEQLKEVSLEDGLNVLDAFINKKLK